MEKERDREIREHQQDVLDLEKWRPATPLLWRPNKQYTRAELIAHQLESHG